MPLLLMLVLILPLLLLPLLAFASSFLCSSPPSPPRCLDRLTWEMAQMSSSNERSPAGRYAGQPTHSASRCGCRLQAARSLPTPWPFLVFSFPRHPRHARLLNRDFDLLSPIPKVCIRCDTLMAATSQPDGPAEQSVLPEHMQDQQDGYQIWR